MLSVNILSISSNSCFYLPPAVPLIAASIVTVGSAFKLSEIFEAKVKEIAWLRDRREEVLWIGKVVRAGSVCMVITLTLLEKGLLLGTSALLMTTAAIVAIAANYFLVKKQQVLPPLFHYFSSEERPRFFPALPLEIEKGIVTTYLEPKPVQRFKEWCKISRVNKAFHQCFRAFQAQVINDHLEIESRLFIRRFEALLQFAKCYGVTKLHFYSLSEEQCNQLVQEVPSLTHLKISGGVKGGGMRVLAGLQNLEYLEIRATDRDVPSFASFTKLQYLRADFHLSSFFFMKYLYQSHQLPLRSPLKHLELRGDILIGWVKNDVPLLATLDSFVLDISNYGSNNANLNKTLIEILGKLSQLQTFTIIGWNITDENCEAISKATELKNLRIKFSSASIKNTATIYGYQKLAALKDLVSLHLFSVSKEGFKCIVESFSKLESLGMKASSFKDGDLMPLNRLVYLRHLDISFCRQITGSCFSELAGHLKELRSLNMINLLRLTEEGFQNLLQFKKLEKLNIDACGWIKEQHLWAIAEQLPHLQILIIAEFPVSFNKAAFKRKYPYLKIKTTTYRREPSKSSIR